MGERVVGKRIFVGERRADHLTSTVRHRRPARDLHRAERARSGQVGREHTIGHDRGSADAKIVETVRGRHAERSRLGQRRRARRRAIGKIVLVNRLFGTHAVEAVDRDTVIGPVDRDLDRRRRRIAVAIRDRISERVGERLARRQPLNNRVRVIERVGVSATGTDHDRAVRAGNRRRDIARSRSHRSHGNSNHRRTVSALNVGRAAVEPGDHIAISRQRTILGHIVRVRIGRRNIVDNVDHKVGVRRIAVAVGDRDRERVGLGAGDVGRHRGQLVGISVAARGVTGHGQNAVGAVHRPAIGHICTVDE